MGLVSVPVCRKSLARALGAAMMAVATVAAIMGRMAACCGKLVSWETAFNSELELKPDRYAWDGTPPAVPTIQNEQGSSPSAASDGTM